MLDLETKYKESLNFIYYEDQSIEELVGNIQKANGDYEYMNVKTSSVWSDVHTTTGNVRNGLFAGYTKNLGADDNLATNANGFVGLYSRGSNIDYVYQFGPRLEIYSGKFMVGIQILYTSAAYGITQVNGTVSDSKEVGSSRYSLHLKYPFQYIIVFS